MQRPSLCGTLVQFHSSAGEEIKRAPFVNLPTKRALVSHQGRDGGRHRDGGRVPPPEQDGAVQCAEGDQGCRSQEAVPEVLGVLAWTRPMGFCYSRK